MKSQTNPELSFRIELERTIRAPIEDVFDVLLEETGPGFESPDGDALSLKLEPFPGGRWYRDLDDENGHLWGNVQSIMRPTLLELRGPMFMSTPTVNCVQYRLEELNGATTLRMTHAAVGPLPDDAPDNMPRGWNHQLDCIQSRFPSA